MSWTANNQLRKFSENFNHDASSAYSDNSVFSEDKVQMRNDCIDIRNDSVDMRNQRAYNAVSNPSG